MNLGAQLWKVHLGHLASRLSGVTEDIEALRRDMEAHSVALTVEEERMAALNQSLAARDVTMDAIAAQDPGLYSEIDIFGAGDPITVPSTPAPATVLNPTDHIPSVQYDYEYRTFESTDRNSAVRVLFIAGAALGLYLIYRGAQPSARRRV